MACSFIAAVRGEETMVCLLCKCFRLKSKDGVGLFLDVLPNKVCLQRETNWLSGCFLCSIPWRTCAPLPAIQPPSPAVSVGCPASGDWQPPAASGRETGFGFPVPAPGAVEPRMAPQLSPNNCHPTIVTQRLSPNRGQTKLIWQI